jgi:16S rRNA (cytosine967-C5)-methyltransferase
MGEDWQETMSIRYSHPEWLVKAFEERLGREGAEALLRADNGQPPTMAQVNTCKASVSRVKTQLEAQDVQAEEHPWLPECLTLRGTGDLGQLGAYRDGLLYIQDSAAKLSVLAADPKPGQRVLDCCAAPGGKSFAAAIAMGNEGEVLSCDIHPHKIKLIQAGRDRLGLDIVHPCLQNGAQLREEWRERFDVVITDVPCSGLGIIRKKPDIRYKDPGPLNGLPKVQAAILENCAQYVRPGGTLLYSTCTLLRQENEDVVEAFLADHPEFTLAVYALPGIGQVNGMLTLWPHIQHTDGFFMAKLMRKG